MGPQPYDLASLLTDRGKARGSFLRPFAARLGFLFRRLRPGAYAFRNDCDPIHHDADPAIAFPQLAVDHDTMNKPLSNMVKGGLIPANSKGAIRRPVL